MKVNDRKYQRRAGDAAAVKLERGDREILARKFLGRTRPRHWVGSRELTGNLPHVSYTSHVFAGMEIAFRG